MTDGAAVDDEPEDTDGGGSRQESDRGGDGAVERADGDNDEHDDARGESDHLADVEDGAGCTEIWERLSERREE